MDKRKRSRSINLQAMRKPAAYSVFVSGSLLLNGCSEEAEWYQSVDECIQDTDCVDFCKTAYQDALSEASIASPKYRTLSECEYDFGQDECAKSDYRYSPVMAGFLVPDDVDCDRRGSSYFGRSIFRPKSKYSSLRGKLVTSDGNVIGSAYKKGFNVNSSTFKSRPTSSKTFRRGGFGSTVSAKSFSGKSSWGG